MDISLSETKRELVILGHRLSLVEASLTQKEDFSQALKAHRATCSVIEAIVEVGHMLEGGIDKLVWKEPNKIIWKDLPTKPISFKNLK